MASAALKSENHDEISAGSIIGEKRSNRKPALRPGENGGKHRKLRLKAWRKYRLAWRNPVAYEIAK
jgi:hypothetical protein